MGRGKLQRAMTQSVDEACRRPAALRAESFAAGQKSNCAAQAEYIRLAAQAYSPVVQCPRHTLGLARREKVQCRRAADAPLI
jgi:hypothetical protein